MAPIRYAHPDELNRLESEIFSQAVAGQEPPEISEYQMVSQSVDETANKDFVDALVGRDQDFQDQSEDEWEFLYPEAQTDGVYEVWQNKRTGEYKTFKFSDLPVEPLINPQLVLGGQPTAQPVITPDLVLGEQLVTGQEAVPPTFESPPLISAEETGPFAPLARAVEQQGRKQALQKPEERLMPQDYAEPILEEYGVPELGGIDTPLGRLTGRGVIANLILDPINFLPVLGGIPFQELIQKGIIKAIGQDVTNPRAARLLVNALKEGDVDAARVAAEGFQKSDIQQGQNILENAGVALAQVEEPDEVAIALSKNLVDQVKRGEIETSNLDRVRGIIPDEEIEEAKRIAGEQPPQQLRIVRPPEALAHIRDLPETPREYDIAIEMAGGNEAEAQRLLREEPDRIKAALEADRMSGQLDAVEAGVGRKVPGVYPEEGIAGGPRPVDTYSSTLEGVNDLSNEDLIRYYRFVRANQDPVVQATADVIKRDILPNRGITLESVDNFLAQDTADVVQKATRAPYIPFQSISNRTDLETQLVGAFKIKPEEAKFVGDLTDARASAWAQQSGLTTEEWYTTHITRVTQEEVYPGFLEEAKQIYGQDANFRAVTVFYNDGRTIMHAVDNPDLGTVVHEVGHIFRRDLDEESLGVIARWGGDENPLKLSRETEEKFANGFMQYLKTGQSPTPELVDVFERFKAWLSNIYKVIMGSPVEISDDVRRVYDSLLIPNGRLADNIGQAPTGALAQGKELSKIGQDYLEWSRRVEEGIASGSDRDAAAIFAGAMPPKPSNKEMEAISRILHPEWFSQTSDLVGQYHALTQAIRNLTDAYGGMMDPDPASQKYMQYLNEKATELRASFTPEQEATYQALIKGGQPERLGEMGVVQTPSGRAPVEPESLPGTLPRELMGETGVGERPLESLTASELMAEADRLGVPMNRRGILAGDEAARSSLIERIKKATAEVPEGVQQPGGAPAFPTIQDVLKTPTPQEELAARQAADIPARQTGLPGEVVEPIKRNPIFRAGDFQKVADRQIGQLTGGRPLSAMQRNLQGPNSPGFIRTALQMAEPTAAAVARDARGEPVALAFTRRDLFLGEQTAELTGSLYDWIGRAKQTIGFDGGRAKNIPYAGEVPTVRVRNKLTRRMETKPDPNIGRLDHIIENPDKYLIGVEQRQFLQELMDTEEELIRAELALGIKPKTKDLSQIITSFPKGTKTLPKTIDEAIKKGYGLVDPITSLNSRWASRIAEIANHETVNNLRTLGKTPTERANAIMDDMIKNGSEDLRVSLNEAKDEYRRVRATNNREDIASSAEKLRRINAAMSGIKSQAKQLEPDESQRLGRIFPKEIADEMDKYYQFGERNADTWNEAMQLWRSTLTLGDYSQLGVQGWNMFMSVDKHLAWWKSSVGSIVSSFAPYSQVNYINKNWSVILEGIRAGAITPPTEFLIRGIPRGDTFVQKAAINFQKIPGVKATQSAFEWFTFLGQSELWKAKDGLIASGIPESEIASFVRRTVGVIQRPGLTKSEKSVTDFMLFASRWFGSMVGTLVDAGNVTKIAGKSSFRNNEARKTIGQVLAGGIALTTGIEYALNGKAPNWTEPDRSDWASIHMGGGTVSLFGPWHPWFRTMAKTGQHWGENNIKQVGEDLAGLAIGRASLPLSLGLEYLTGRNLATGEERKYSTNPNILWNIGENLAYFAETMGGNIGPIGPSQVAQSFLAPKADGQPFFTEALGELFGLRTNPYTPSQYRNKLRDNMALQNYSRFYLEEYGQDISGYNDLRPAHQLDIDEMPDIRAIDDFATQVSIERGGPFGRYLGKLSKADDDYALGMDRVVRQFDLTSPEKLLLAGKKYREARSENMKLRAKMREEARTEFEPYKDDFGDTRPTDPEVEAVFSLDMDTYSQAGAEYKFFEDRDAMIKALDADQKADFDALGERYLLNLPRHIQELEKVYLADRDKLQPYWDIQRVVAKSAAGELAPGVSIGDAYLAVKRLEAQGGGSAILAKQARERMGDNYKRIDNLISDARLIYRKSNPLVDIAGLRQGYWTTLSFNKP